ncbi:uncharacterized protein BJ212DRAFT_1298409 [Suillus subaureus]|uniref:Uncharacterized protein n=1 Tax=Suillus subaureus TaxID=48587 RepID=A0A9P7EE75_9AGAM|nr:uncharacterized protein BJ212DRAFT_1298409 [Suillus subaureus]KAG1819158.1 hypothetical protein BJ212DRAFT_1298409 [Suillus subaureus]
MWLEDIINSIAPSEGHNMDSTDDKNINELPHVSYDSGLGGKENFHYFGKDDIPEGTGGHKVHSEVMDPAILSAGDVHLGVGDTRSKSSEASADNNNDNNGGHADNDEKEEEEKEELMLKTRRSDGKLHILVSNLLSQF